MCVIVCERVLISVCDPPDFTDARTHSPLYRGDGDDASWFSCLRRVGKSIKELFDEVLLGQKSAEGESECKATHANTGHDTRTQRTRRFRGLREP